MWPNKNKPYVLKFSEYSEKEMAQAFSHDFGIELSAEELLSASTLGGLCALIRQKCEGKWTEGTSATAITFARLKALIPNSDSVRPSTPLREIDGFNYARLAKSLVAQYDWKVFSTRHLFGALPSIPLILMFYWTNDRIIEPLLGGINQPWLFIVWIVILLIFFAACYAYMTVMNNMVNHFWPRRYPGCVETLGELTTVLAGLNQDAMVRDGAAFNRDSVWSGIVALFVVLQREPARKLTPDVGWKVKKPRKAS